MKCAMCDIEMPTDKKKTCSPRCRQALHRRESVTGLPSVTHKKDPSVTFHFTVPYSRTPKDDGYDANEAKKRATPREAIYWYNVPLAAIPVYEKGWPKMPEYMNGRQYFLWWKNDFKVSDKIEDGPIGDPIILNPLPERNDVKYVMGGQQSRQWGA